MKKMLSVLFCFLLMFNVVVFAEGVREESETSNDLALTILHTNDNHSHLDVDYKGRYGAGKIDYMADQMKKAYKNVLMVNAGDAVMGTIFYTIFEGTADRDVMNMTGYDAMTFGNHEFDGGLEGLSKFITGLNVPIVNTNIDFKDESKLENLVNKYIIKKYEGRSVGIIGVTTPETTFISNPGDTIVFQDIIDSTQPVINKLESMGINIIVMLSHTGYLNDQIIAAELEGVDVIVGGHSHTKLENYPNVIQSVSDEPVLIVQANEYNKYLGNLTVVFDEDGVAKNWWGAPIIMDSSIPQDPEIAAYVAEKNAKLAPFTGQILGTSKSELIRSRTEESNLGNLIADAMLDSLKDQGVEIALTNGGGIRADVGIGEISMQALMEVLPFGNLLATFEMKGSDLWQVFEHSVSRVEEGSGRFLQMAGAKIVWDPTKAPGERIVEIFVGNNDEGWGPVDHDRIYKMVANNYIRGGGDDYQVLKEKAINPYDAGALDIDVMTEFFKKNSPIDYKTEGRIRRVGE